MTDDRDELTALRVEHARQEARIRALEGRLDQAAEAGVESASRRSRRDLMKLAAATTAGAIGARALVPIVAHAGGSADSLVPFAPYRVVDTRSGLGGVTGARGAYTWTTFGPFPIPGGTGFTTASYTAAFLNLTITGWSGRGYASAADSSHSGSGPGAAPGYSNVNFGGSDLGAIGNLLVVQFAAGSPASDGKVAIWVANSSAHIVIDLQATLTTDNP